MAIWALQDGRIIMGVSLCARGQSPSNERRGNEMRLSVLCLLVLYLDVIYGKMYVCL